MATLPTSGTISMDDIVTEFGGSAPDNTNEYYRGGGLVSDNNTNVPTSGTISLENFYSGEKQHQVVISSNVNNIVLTDYFTETEWIDADVKVIKISAGVTVGSTSIATRSIRTGTTINGSALGGTLKIINDGFIYAAGGAGGTDSGGAGDVGGDALNAEIPVEVDNANGRIYGGGGGGGAGGFGGTVYYYPDDVTVKLVTAGDNTMWVTHTTPTLGFINYAGVTIQSGSNQSSPYTYGGNIYYKGVLDQTYLGQSRYYINYRLELTQTGGAAGDGGAGIGSNQAAGSGDGGTVVSTARDGGDGGAGGGWGQAGSAGSLSQSVDTNYMLLIGGTITSGAGGAAGKYIIGNSNVTWINTGDRLGLVG